MKTLNLKYYRAEAQLHKNEQNIFLILRADFESREDAVFALKWGISVQLECLYARDDVENISQWCIFDSDDPNNQKIRWQMVSPTGGRIDMEDRFFLEERNVSINVIEAQNVEPEISHKAQTEPCICCGFCDKDREDFIKHGLLNDSISELLNGSESETDVHTRHCCHYCGCKYGDNDCTVVNRLKKQSFNCGWTSVCYYID